MDKEHPSNESLNELKYICVDLYSGEKIKKIYHKRFQRDNGLQAGKEKKLPEFRQL